MSTFDTSKMVTPERSEQKKRRLLASLLESPGSPEDTWLLFKVQGFGFG